MAKTVNNPCIRCGKERIVLRTWKEQTTTFSGFVVEEVHSENICPDSECQEIVEKELQKQKDKRDLIKQKRLERK